MRATSWLRVGIAVCSLLPVISGYAIRDTKAAVVERGFIVTYIADKEALASKLGKRQEEGQQDTTEPTRTSAARSTPVSSSRGESTTTSDEGNKSEPTSRASKTEGPTQTDLAPTVAGGDPAAETSVVPDKNGLPYTPPLTPAFAFAGLLLLVCGLPYTLAGVRHKQIHIFLSTCLLSSLGVTVLIIYVMNPPASNALQGGYVAAIAITGMIFGGLAVIFPEVTEVLACLLGGFCLAQWFLVLKAGGLVQGGYQKIIFILCFSIGLFCLALHHTTRPYGMIFSIAFSGATATVLGIDFFSRAGLKEFWLYVWGLNENIFPLETNTFPLTRGIRVEIAAIVVITCFGIISQMKLWQVIKQKREEREEARKQRQADTEAMEAENGRRVEEAAQRDREVWEKQYGDKSHTTTTLVPEDQTASMSASAELNRKHLSRDSGLPQSSKDSTDGGSSKNVVTDNIEMVGLQKVPSGQEATAAAPGTEGQVPVPPHAREGEITTHPQAETAPVPVEPPAPTGPPEPKFFAPAVVIREKGDVEEPIAPGSSANNGVSGLTTVHTVIIDPNQQEDDDDASSLATFADSVHDDKRKSMAISVASIQPMNEIQEIPHDDAASSVAGVLDDEEDERSEDEMPLVGEDIGRKRSVISLKGRRNSLSSNKRMSIVSLVRKASQRSNKSNRPLSAQSQVPLSPQSPVEGPKEGKEDEKATEEKKGSTPTSPIEPPKVISRRQSLALPSEGAALEAASEKEVIEKAGEEKTVSRRTSVVGSVRQEEATAPGSPAKDTAGQPKSRKEAKAPAVGPPAPLRHGSLQAIRPPSKIVKTYRVSEWAKHLDPADEPQYDDIEPLQTPETVQEKAAPVHVMELQEGASSAKVPPPIQGLSRSDTYQSMQAGNMVSRTNTLTTIREAPIFVPTMQGQTVAMHVPTHVYQVQAPTSPMIPSSPQIPTVVIASPPPSRGGQPAVQVPITNQPIVESPTEDVEMGMPQRSVSPTPSQLPPMCETLLTKRESMLKATPNFSTVADNTSIYGQSITQPQPFQNPSLPNASASTLSLNRRSVSGASTIQQQRSSSGTNYAASMIGSAAPSSRIPSMEMQPGMLANYSPYVTPISPVIPSSPMMPSIPVPHGAVEMTPPQPPQHSPGDRRENMLKAWRESLMQDQVISARTHNSIQGRRNEMIQESAMQNMYGKQKEMEKAMRDNMVEERYRNRDMLSIHREAMKRMQDKAKGI
ncbi:uncharacterized protein DFL_001280 [Arthrobotrys flagrans]|uniref:TM7S3/TM198-like domain-containing protein n=1 Tax=Arthrobotrys flagrans TaxID=97331 RepID=A0A437AGN1_ARTFL|nr:hypothetical protein DFL_001280 [Arthrobotrys flagrans]